MKHFQRTIEALSKSHNDAAGPTLMAALDAGSGPVFDGAVTGLVARRNKTGHLAVLQRWHTLTPAMKQVVEKGRPRMGGALREALLDGDDQLFANARDFVEASGDFDLIPTLVMVAEQPSGERSQAAIELTMRLIDQLCQWIESDREPVIGRDPQTIRYCVLESLERSVERFRQHQRAELVEAFVVLAGPHSNTLLSVMDAPHHPCFQSVIHTLTTSPTPSVLKLLTTLLTTKDAPQVARNVISKRTDRPFVEALLATPLDHKCPPLRRNLARIKSIACCEAVNTVCNQYSPAQQIAAMQLLASSGAPDEHKLDLAEALLKGGSMPGRVAACTCLHGIHGQRSNRLILTALTDPEGPVQAAAVRQLRERRIPGTMGKLIELVSSPDEAVSTAAREALSEFSFENYSTRFDVLDEDARRAMGTRVAKVDRTSVARLKQELANSSRRQRLRGLEMAGSMGLFPQLADALIERLQDEDHMVRVAAAEALQHCAVDDVRKALRQAVGDRSVAVQNAAKNSLRALGEEPAAFESSDATALVAEAAV